MYVYALSLDINRLKINKRYICKQGYYTDYPKDSLNIKEALIASQVYRATHPRIKNFALSGVWIRRPYSKGIMPRLDIVLKALEPEGFVDDTRYNLAYRVKDTLIFVDAYVKDNQGVSVFKGASPWGVLATAFYLDDKPIEEALLYNVETGTYVNLLDSLVSRKEKA